MYLKRFLLIHLFLIALLSNIFSQNIADNSILVQLETGISPRAITEKILRDNNIVGKISIERVCSTPVNIWKFRFDKRNQDIDRFILYLSNVGGVEKAQINHKIILRSIPDDTKFSKQWSLKNTGQTGGTINADIDADLAWDRTTGGVTKNGDTIVICIIDTGIDSDHEDLKDNLWINYNEIEDNGIDDDNNGYVDDYRGWNPVTENDDIEGKNHGTSVAGIIGAKGNNGKGIAGINWDVKLLILPMSGEEADVIAAYSYVYTMRKLYNDTKGAKGAFIVATNNSFGKDNSFAKDFPIWCSMYDLMGEVGVASIVATSNANTDVDLFGDMPSTCPSDFIISVTNMDFNNKKYSSSGYGRINVDLGAFGANTYSTKGNNGYGLFGGTSAATPHVTGVFGLLYSDNKKIADNCVNYPVQSELMVRDAILNGVVHNKTLEGISVTEGVLNANEALKKLDKYDGDCSPPVQINIDTIGGDMFTIKWNDYDSQFKYNIRYRVKNGVWIKINDIESPFTLKDLNSCTDYYFTIQKICSESSYGFINHVKTDGCCFAPKITEYSISENNLHVEWENILAAKKYRVNYKFWSHPIWDEIFTERNHIDLDIDYECGQYAVSLLSVCEDSLSGISNNILSGKVCVECKTNDYCSKKIDNLSEWIESFSIDGFSNRSGEDLDGIGNYTDSKAIKLIGGNEYEVNLEVKYKTVHYNDFINIWIDMNSDSLFSIDELVAVDSTEEKENITFSFTMPDNLIVGESTLRVLLSDKRKTSPCDIDDNDYGEYEDYCVYLDTISDCNAIKLDIDTIDVGIDFVQLGWNNPDEVSDFYITIFREDAPFDKVVEKFISDTMVIIDGLDSCTSYEINIAPYCSDIEQGITNTFEAKTHCSTLVEEFPLNTIIIYPSPLKNRLYIDGLDGDKEIVIEVFDSFGRRIFFRQYHNRTSLIINFKKGIKSGLYFVKIKQGNNYFNKKIIKI